MLMEQINTATEARTLFEIPAENIEKFEAQIKKLSARSIKLGMDAIVPFTFSHEERKLASGRTHRVYQVMLTAEAPRLNGWTFVARLDHANETGTVIRMVPNTGVELPLSFRHAETRCDHCNVNRYRRDTFVVRNDESGEFKQVGSTCLADFLGHDPQKIAKRAELLSYAYECGRGYEQFVGGDMRYISLESFLQDAAYFCRTRGWVSGKTAYETGAVATKTRVLDSMNGGEYCEETFVTDEDKALAAAALEAALAITEPRNNYEHNVAVIANASMIEGRSAGVAAAIVGVFFDRRRREQNAPQQIGSFEEVIALMQKAGAKLRYPKIRLQTETGQKIVLSVAGAKSKAPGTVNVTDGGSFEDGTWFGRVSPDGKWAPSGRVSAATQAGVTALLTSLAQDAAGTASKYGKMTGQCCFCSKPLTDARSTEVGYGGTCAKNYGMPWGTPGRKAS